ncbi:hypothetical protein Aab01nite_81640 [Paractinoplanes abujensis]|uniref:YtkA-like domain-containing protein n=1 Tax=Paractinoplanes abujensis TaxID=882441 RepID=A0A7W7G2P6_9ACTN|nr:hypothetical protein [Actinoplanes abujensis]MBB4693370.1 hypothetical protein [Actinoplanes abujensis]GID24574.1 hypothetical protein Aab01nite_81640 [Actinoplanes abujensis]
MRRTGIALTAGLMLAFVPVATPAWAHEGKLKLEVAGDGATGITVQAEHADGHQLEDMVRLVVSATAAGGQRVGPIQLEPAGEGQGFYLSGPILTPGDWRVTVRAPAPYTSESTVAVRARSAQTPPPPAAKAADPAGSGSRWRWWLLGCGAVAAAGLATALTRALRRRQP